MFRRPGLRKKKRARRRVLLYLILFLALLIWCLLAVERALIPTLLAISETQVARVANQAMIDAINENIAEILEGKELVKYEISAEGKLLYISTNAAELNKLQAEALTVLQEAMEDLDGFTIAVPFGQTLGSRIFAPAGPSIKVQMQPYGTVQVQVMDEFEVTGINQTKYRLFLRVSCMVRVIIPLISSRKEITTDIPLTTIIVPGEIPNTYLQVPALPGTQPTPPR